tara:strand:+ start:1430 stop:2320 length:891 start_codon:yes stop_codon:yes gene_type:complete
MKILLLGANGQLGKELNRQLPEAGFVEAFSRSLLDITNYKSVQDTVDLINPDIIINAAAYTAVDKAEDNKEKAFGINSDAVKNLAKIAKTKDALLIHYSTDYVFDGTKPIPYVENDETKPINVYGASKLAGERAILEINCNHLIFRTTWVIGKDGDNFAKTIIKLASKRNSLDVINDQLGVPTSPSLITKVTLNAIQAIKKNKAWPKGIYHLAPSGVSSWFEIAETLVEFANSYQKHQNFKLKVIKAIKTEEYQTPAKRPLNSQLNTNKISSQLTFNLPCWKDDFLVVTKEIFKEF